MERLKNGEFYHPVIMWFIMYSIGIAAGFGMAAITMWLLS